MASAQLSASLSLSIHDVCPSPISSPRTYKVSRLPISSFSRRSSTFATGSPLLIRRTFQQRKLACKATPISIRCEQSTQGGNSLDVWLGRLAMVGFAVAITVEISTGKGLLEVSTVPLFSKSVICIYVRTTILKYASHALAEFWPHDPLANCSLGSNSIGWCFDSYFHLSVRL
ncbi:hypothetical protein REPUB_Repub04eG0077700 [Reevesia pubescens]